MKSFSFIPIAAILLVASCAKNEHGVHQYTDAQAHSQMAMLDKEQQTLAGIEIDTARVSGISAQIKVFGKAVEDQNEIRSITARVDGRIEKLHVRQEGEFITDGQALYSVYSEALLADQNDYLSALEQQNKFVTQKAAVNALIQSARRKLVLWGMTDQQLRNLDEKRIASSSLIYYSKNNGFVAKLLINEGQYVETGTPLFEIADLRSIWIEAHVYQDEIKYLSDETKAIVSMDGLPGKEFTGQLAFKNPVLEENTKINLVRFKVENPGNLVKPGMMARVIIPHQGKRALIIPKSALLVGEMRMVWIETTPGMYERRSVQTGIENEAFVEIVHGLTEGDRVVTSGSYLLNSEFILKQGAVKAHSH